MYVRSVVLNSIHDATWEHFYRKGSTAKDVISHKFHFTRKKKNPKGISVIPLSRYTNSVRDGCITSCQRTLGLVYTCLSIVLKVPYVGHSQGVWDFLMYGFFEGGVLNYTRHDFYNLWGFFFLLSFWPFPALITRTQTHRSPSHDLCFRPYETEKKRLIRADNSYLKILSFWQIGYKIEYKNPPLHYLAHQRNAGRIWRNGARGGDDKQRRFGREAAW